MGNVVVHCQLLRAGSLALILFLAAEHARAQDAVQLCRQKVTEDGIRPIPQSLVWAAKRIFGLRMPDQQVLHSTVFRCADGHALLCTYERILHDLRAYLTTAIDREWPDMRQRNENRAAAAYFQSLWQTVDTLKMEPADPQIRGEMLTLFCAAYESRETRAVSDDTGNPGPRLGACWSYLPPA
jgi:hypothetical protein